MPQNPANRRATREAAPASRQAAPPATAPDTALVALVGHVATAGEAADKLGTLKAQAAEIEAKMAAVKNIIRDAGWTEGEGRLFRFTATPQTRKVLDRATLIEAFGEDLIRGMEKEVVSTPIRVVSR